MHIVLQTGLIIHCGILKPEMECSGPEAKPRTHLADVLVNDPKSSAHFSLLRWDRNDSYRFKVQFYSTAVMSSPCVFFLRVSFSQPLISPLPLFLGFPALLKTYLRSRGPYIHWKVVGIFHRPSNLESFLSLSTQELNGCT